MMKQILKIISYRGILTGMALLLLSSCLVDEREARPDDLIQPERDGSEVTFALEVPATSYTRGGTKSLPNEDNDLKVTDFQVLVFDPEEDEFLYSTSTTKVTATDTINIKKITVKLLDGLLENNTYDLIFLANARSIVQSLYPGGITKGLSKEEVLESLCYETTGRIIAASGGTFTSIPMWGKRNRVRLGQTDLTTNPIELVRSVAKVNLSISDDAFQNFTLQSVHVYNYIPGGYLAPLTNEWTGDDTIESPYIPARLDPVKTPLLYTEITAGKSIRDIIYLFEAAKGSPATLLDNICLVVGGAYKGTTGYYRLDFVDKTNNYTSLLRNYCYEVVVTSINGAGYSTPDEAFRAGPFDIEVEILNWCEGDMKEFVIDGQYLISLSQGEFTFSREERHEFSTDNKLTVYTNYPEGWYVLKSSIIDDETGTTPTWLELSANNLTVSGDTLRWGTAQKEQITLLIDEYTSIIPLGRSASFMVRAGRLNYQVKVKQTYEAGSNVNIYILNSEGAEINYLEFPGNSTDPKEMILTWSPALENQFVTVLNMVDKSSANKFPFRVPVFTVGEEFYGNPNPGRRSFTITPELMTATDPFHENSTTVTFEIEYGTKKVEKDFTFIQINRGIKVITEDSYPANGGIQSFTIQSNTAWKGELVNGGGVVTELLTTSGGNAPSGETVNFQTINYEGEDTRTAEFWFTSYTNEFDTVKVYLNFYGKFILTATNASSYKANGNIYSFNVTANRAWTVTRTGSGIRSFSPFSGTAGTTRFTMSTEDLNYPTTATYLFTSGTQSVPVIINQTANNFTLTTNGMESAYEADGSSYSFQVTANRNWTASLAGSPELITDILTPSGTTGTSTFSFRTLRKGTSGSETIRFYYTDGITNEYQDVIINFRESDELIIITNLNPNGYETLYIGYINYSFTVQANKAWTLDASQGMYVSNFIPNTGGSGETRITFRTYGGSTSNTNNPVVFSAGSSTETVYIKTLGAKFDWNHSGVKDSYDANGDSYSFTLQTSSPVTSLEVSQDTYGYISSVSRNSTVNGGPYGHQCTVTFVTNSVSRRNGQATITFRSSIIGGEVIVKFNQ